MKKIFLSILIYLIIFSAGALMAQNKKQADVKNKVQQSKIFVDKNGDGYNDNAPDHDGDGIPNCLDPDFKCSKAQKGEKGFIDRNGDGINDNNPAVKNKFGKLGFGAAKGCASGNGSKRKAKGKNN